MWILRYSISRKTCERDTKRLGGGGSENSWLSFLNQPWTADKFRVMNWKDYCLCSQKVGKRSEPEHKQRNMYIYVGTKKIQWEQRCSTKFWTCCAGLFLRPLSRSMATDCRPLHTRLLCTLNFSSILGMSLVLQAPGHKPGRCTDYIFDRMKVLGERSRCHNPSWAWHEYLGKVSSVILTSHILVLIQKEGGAAKSVRFILLEPRLSGPKWQANKSLEPCHPYV